MKFTILKISFFLYALASLFRPIPAQAQGNLVVNGGFDTDASGWFTTDIGYPGGYEPGKGDPGGYFLLSATPLASIYPTISQTITGLVPGTSYMVSGNYTYSESYGSGSPAVSSFGVALEGAFLFEAAVPTTTAWQSFDFIYNANSSSAVLSLASEINGTPVGYVIDNISIVAVPEQNSLWLTGLGGIMGAVFLKTRRKPCV